MKKALILLAIFAVSAMGQTPNPVTKGYSQKFTLTTFWSKKAFQAGKNSIKDFSIMNVGTDTAYFAFNTFDTTTAPSVYNHVKLFSVGSVPLVYNARTNIDSFYVKGSTTGAVMFINATYSK